MSFNLFIAILIVVVVAFLILFIFFVLKPPYKDFEKRLTNIGNAVCRAKYNVINDNKEILKQTIDTNADIHSDAVNTIMSSVKEGLTSKDGIHCKYYGKEIEADSLFCKHCGKQL